MSFVVKWRFTRTGEIHRSPIGYPSPELALDFARIRMRRYPSAVWIEGPGRMTIERATIERLLGAHKAPSLP